jgi:hypothetical protein
MLNIFNKNENTTESPFWKWAYIGLVILISVAYFIFSYYYIQLGKYIELGGTEFEIKDKYKIHNILQHTIAFCTILVVLISRIKDKKIFWSTMFIFFWVILCSSNYLIAKLALFIIL